MSMLDSASATAGAAKPPDTFSSIPRTTFESLPDELLVEIVGYAMTTSKIVVIAPNTMRKDVMRIKQQLLAPFAKPPKLLTMAERDFRAENLTYCFNIHDISVNENIGDRERPMPEHVNGGSDVCHIGAPACPELFLGTQWGKMWLGTGAHWIKHLEIVAPSVIQNKSSFRRETPRIVFDDYWKSKAPSVFAHLPKTFPFLETFLVRLITCRTGGRNVVLEDSSTGQIWRASQRPDLVAMALAQKVANFIDTMDRYNPRSLKWKTLILFQQHEIDWPGLQMDNFADLKDLERPKKDVQRLACGAADAHDVAWHIMDLPSCQLIF